MNPDYMPAYPQLAHAYVPYQTWEVPYAPEVALERGTIFPSLDMPYEEVYAI